MVVGIILKRISRKTLTVPTFFLQDLEVLCANGFFGLFSLVTCVLPPPPPPPPPNTSRSIPQKPTNQLQNGRCLEVGIARTIFFNFFLKKGLSSHWQKIRHKRSYVSFTLGKFMLSFTSYLISLRLQELDCILRGDTAKPSLYLKASTCYRLQSV